MRRLWKIIKENFPVALAMATTFLSIVYAGMRLMIYVYWMGYFKELNIDANILEINYEGNLFQVIFYGGIILLIVYIFGMLDETYKKVREQIRNKEGTWLKKLFFAIGKTAKSILISCGARLAPFDIKEVREITMYDELELDLVGDRKTALFFIISDTDATFNFLVSMAYTQLFNLLCERADDKYGGRLPVHVRCLIDEAANIGQIPNLEKLMATIRSREISACLVLQAQSQLKALYKDNMDTIIGNCDASLFLGGKEETTLKSWNSLLGKETIDMYNTSVTKGTQESHGQNFQKLGKDLMSVDELAVMDGGKCLLQIRGVRPFLSRKYDITRHPNYRLLSDFNEKNAFDIEKFLSTKMPMRPGELYRNYEVTAEDLEAPAI